MRLIQGKPPLTGVQEPGSGAGTTPTALAEGAAADDGTANLMWGSSSIRSGTCTPTPPSQYGGGSAHPGEPYPFQIGFQMSVRKSDILQIQAKPSLFGLSYIRTACKGGSASVAAKTRHFEGLSDLRVSGLRTVSCTVELQ
jgi:hypothetical protein